MTLFEMKEKQFELQNELSTIKEYILEKSADPTFPIEDLDKKKAKAEELKKRIDVFGESIKEEEEAQRKALIGKSGTGTGMTEAQAKLKAKADFYRAAFMGSDKQKAYEGLGAIPADNADLGHGDRLLPTNLSNEIIVEPMVENPMREIISMSNATGLEEPKLSFELDGVFDDVTDKETAKEIKMDGDTVTYGRHKVKVKAKISDTIVHGTDLALVNEVENALRSGLAVNEMARMFAKSPGDGYKEMSFYSTENAVKAVEGATKREAIAKALADLPIAFRQNARIVMSATDWFDMWGDNLNHSGTFYEDRPLSLFGKPVVLVDEATDPIVGNFSYARINYDIGAIYDTDKNVDTGMYLFVLTAWYDIKLRLKSAFRIAKVNP